MKTKTVRTGKKTGKQASKKPVRAKLSAPTKGEMVPRQMLRELEAATERAYDNDKLIAKLQVDVASLGDKIAELEWAKRRCVEYYALVDKLLKERDQWKEMFLEQSSGNSNAQSHLMTELNKANAMTMLAIRVLNNDRIVAGIPLFELVGKLPDGGTFQKDYQTLMTELMARAPKDTLAGEAIAERDRIKALEGQPEPASAPPVE